MSETKQKSGPRNAELPRRRWSDAQRRIVAETYRSGDPSSRSRPTSSVTGGAQGGGRARVGVLRHGPAVCLAEPRPAAGRRARCMAEEIRVTTDPEFFDEHADDAELWSPGSPLFAGPEPAPSSEEALRDKTLQAILDGSREETG